MAFIKSYREEDEKWDPETQSWVKKEKKKTTLRGANNIIKNIQTRKDIMKELDKQ